MTSDTSLTPAERLILLRKKLGLSQREMAKEFKVSNGAIALWEQGGRPVPGSVLKLLDLYEGSPQDLPEDLRAIFSKNLVVIEEERELLNSLQHYLSDHLSLNYIKGKILTQFVRQLIFFFRESKGLTMKLMQVASYIETGLPHEARKALAKFPQSSKPSPYKTVKRIISEDLGQSPEALFSEWSKDPLAVTSLGQVHKARLKSGRLVAVKVQHDDIQKILDKQFKSIDLMARLLTMFKQSDHPVLEDIKEKIHRECDYQAEARQQLRFKKFFEGDPQIVIPDVILEMSSKRVLVTEFIEGLSYQEFIEQGTREQKNAAGLAIHRLLARSAVQTGLIHADPHPANFIFFDGKVAVLDFGRVVEYTGERFEMERRFVHALLTENYSLAQTMIIKMDGIQDPETFNFGELWNFLERQQTHYTRNENFKFSREHLIRLAANARRFSGRRHLKIDKWFFGHFLLAIVALAFWQI